MENARDPHDRNQFYLPAGQDNIDDEAIDQRAPELSALVGPEWD
jgi:hypothetical protein